MKKLLTIIMVVCSVLVTVGQIDDDLSSDALALTRKLEVAHESAAFLYFTGLFAGHGDDPLSVGSQLLQEYRKHEADHHYVVVEYPESKRIPISEEDWLCATSEPDCWKKLFTTDFDNAALRKKYQVLIDRVKTFYAFDEYHTLVKSLDGQESPPYKYISFVGRVNVLDAIANYKEGHREAAIVSLLQHLKETRKMLALQDNLLGKLVFLVIASRIVDAASIMLSESGGAITPDLVPALSQSEKSFDEVSVREFGMHYYNFKKMDRSPEFFEMGGHFPGWLARMIFKTNMSINALAPIYSRLTRLSTMSPFEFAREVESGGQPVVSTSKLRNYIGSVLLSLHFSLDDYVARFMDFDTKLVLFNQIHHFHKKATEVSNPYYEGKYAEVSGYTACFSGPMEDKRQLRCLRVKL